jgi:nucleotide-binding universal stress UspA family protein
MQPPADCPVVVGVDGSPSSTAALDVAATEAARWDRPLRIVYVREPPDRWQTVGRRSPTLVDPDLAVAEAAQRAIDRQPGLRVETQVVDGLPAAVLIEESGRAALTVVGHQGGGGFLGLAAGSVCTQLAIRGRGAVMVVRGSSGLPDEAPVVLGIDADAPVDDAFEFGFAEAALRRVPLHAVYAWNRAETPAADSFGRAREEAAHRLAEATASWAERYPEVKVERLTDHSLEPPAAILAASLGAGLVVLGLHGRTAPRRLVLGSVGDTLVQHSRCPVTIVH